MIVKVQKPLATNDPTPAYLIYDRARTFSLNIPLGEWEDLDTAMTSDPKRFFHADLNRGELNINTNKKCPQDQDW